MIVVHFILFRLISIFLLSLDNVDYLKNYTKMFLSEDFILNFLA